ncbi:hypothetical protein PAECIP111891_06105 [Paenibacillus allorhizoplanae]|uniref:Uncharacterized protein n=1 Tax=Paenibacillus allorhizoplanae TaxID=2905648 RepID=A0ABN8H8P4_9BACL|nr:hypothetical protein PAECIP111891_06105 [Paenibacillus allorhizoplanae]
MGKNCRVLLPSHCHRFTGWIGEGLIAAYEEILTTHKPEMLLEMHAQTMQEESIREAIQGGFREIRGIVLEAFQKNAISNSEERALLFLARSMLCNISMALSLPELMKS